jgi:hypothetical protein
MAKETFVAARARLLRELPSLGYKAVMYNMSHMLKFPYVIGSDGHKTTFKAQSVYGDDDLSIWIDIRGMSAAEFDEYVRAHYKAIEHIAYFPPRQACDRR